MTVRISGPIEFEQCEDCYADLSLLMNVLRVASRNGEDGKVLREVVDAGYSAERSHGNYKVIDVMLECHKKNYGKIKFNFDNGLVEIFSAQCA